MMSARPRPVTATCKPRSMIPPVKPRSYSLSSDTSAGSTDSLVSILDHSSCEDLDSPKKHSLSPSTISQSTGFSGDTDEKHINKKRGSTDSLTSVLDHSSCESSHKDSPACNELKVDNKDHCGPNKATSCQHNCPVSAFIREKKRGSTESLVSVLDHDSIGELELSDEEVQPQPQTQPQPAGREERKNRYRRHTHENVENGMMRHKACINQIEAKKRAPSTDRSPDSEFTELTEDTSPGGEHSADEDGLTSWERWLLTKAKEERERVRAELRRRRRKEEELKKQEQEKLEKQKKGEVKYQEWLEKNLQTVKAKNNQTVHQEKVKSELKEEKKRQIEEKAKHKYEEWASQKKNQEKEKKRKEKEEQERKEREKEDLQKKSDEAYQEWCKKVQNRPQSAQRHTSFGYTSGKLTGYYDTSATPTPTFYNPIPWRPIETPKPKSDKPRRAKNKANNYKWNPNKYL